MDLTLSLLTRRNIASQMPYTKDAKSKSSGAVLGTVIPKDRIIVSDMDETAAPYPTVKQFEG
jgi:hypothetical protein